jgi:hypothetical protein
MWFAYLDSYLKESVYHQSHHKFAIDLGVTTSLNTMHSFFQEKFHVLIDIKPFS